MQPVSLTMRYFGPYKNETIDFSELTETAVFLVSGNTGSGKTTIFDAMCYALFGQTTNDQDRDAAALRSDFAPNDQETSVTFIFEHQGRTYEVTRKPKQTLLGRGNKIVEHSTKVSLIYSLEDEQPTEISKISVANDFIENLLNLTRDQFKQIVLLPQGKFRQFLESSSNDKETLLRDLFNTSLYQKWAQVLKDRLAIQKKQHQTVTTKMITIKESFPNVDSGLSNDEWLKDASQIIEEQQEKVGNISREIEQLQKQTTSLNQKIDHQQRLVDAFNERKQKQDELDGLLQQSPQMKGLNNEINHLTWFQEHQKVYLDYLHAQDAVHQEQRKLQENESLLDQLRSHQNELNKNNSRLEEQQTEINKIREQETVLKNLLPQYEKKAQLVSLVAKQQAGIEKQQATLTKYQTTIQDSEKQLEQIDNQISDLGDLAEESIFQEKQKHQLENVESLFHEYSQHQKQFDKLKAQIDTGNDHLSEIDTQMKNARQRYENLKDVHARNEIARLVQDLKPGSPCPVCGSKEHPHPAPINDQQDKVSSEEVDKANEALMKIQQKHATQQSRLEEWQHQQSRETKMMDQQLHKINDIMGVDSSTATNLKQTVDELRQKVQSQEKELQSHLKLQQQYKSTKVKLQQTVEDTKAKLEDAKAEFNHANEKQTATRANLQTIVDNLPLAYNDQHEAETQLNKWQKKIDKFDQQQKDIQQQLTAINEKIATTHQLITDNQSSIKNYQDQSADLKKKLSLALKKYSADHDWNFWEQSNKKVTQLPAMQRQWQEYQTKRTQLDSLLQRLNDQIGEQSLPDIDQTQKQLAMLQHQMSEGQQKKGELQGNLQSLQDIYQQVIKIHRQQSNELKKIQDLQTISDVMNGNTDSKLSLERYVLQNYLNEVLRVANERLDKLTNGRYAFVLSDDQAKGNGTKWSGLEINVYDDNAGQERSVRTLSGGESFMASLALALGLGEVIQERSGGIQVDALFIDEGFGSLDQDALNQALNALQTIKGYKMIGIISHVTELENQVPNQLQVISQNGVSHVKYRHEINNL